MIAQRKDSSFKVYQHGDDDFVETGELTTQKFVNDEVHAAERDKAAEEGKVPAGNEYLHLHIVIDLS